ncbi:MAG TPA: EAL domain-containing protein, partial [Rhodospirillales bacterium]|nr:EAL domain-containing protein [Rhodospirillales bacterium]
MRAVRGTAPRPPRVRGSHAQEQAVGKAVLGGDKMIPQQPDERPGRNRVIPGGTRLRRLVVRLGMAPPSTGMAVVAAVGAAATLVGAGALPRSRLDPATWDSLSLPWVGAAFLLAATGFVAGRLYRTAPRMSLQRPAASGRPVSAAPWRPAGSTDARRSLTGELERLVRGLRLQQARALLLVVDIDRMRDVNAVYGYRVGDALLAVFERRLEQFRAQIALARRLGGDRFLVLATIGDGTPRLAERILARLRAPLHLGGLELNLRISAGLARFPDHAQEAEKLLRSAELALDQAKLAGGNRLVVYDVRMDAAFRHRKLVEMQIKRGLERREFVLHYQPQFDLASGCVTGVEALLRWPGRPGGALPPGQFVPVAEACGLIRPLGAWLIDEACATARRWLDEGIRVTMCVNISVAQLRHQDVAGLAQRCLERHR